MVSRDFWFIKNNESDKLNSTTKAFCDSIGKYKHKNVIKNIINNMYKAMALQKKRERERMITVLLVKHFYSV